jgi:hypothetical protein
VRRIEYRRLWDIFNSTEEKSFHNFVQLSPTRWLARYNCINVILEYFLKHFEELKLHFNYVVNKEKCYMARMLQDMFNDSSNLLYLKIHCPPKLSHNFKTCVFEPKFISSYNISNCKVLKR